MANTVYQATVTALEVLLPPRVVSRALQEGLQALTKTPATLQYADVDKILKIQVYRQLQVVMPVTEAKTKLQHILETLKRLDAHADAQADGVLDSATAAPSQENQEAALGELRARLKPFNLYFEWPEVQKLRAQLQLLETEFKAGRETTRLLDEARQNLTVVEQKLTDQLVYQAKALGELSASLEVVKALGGAKVRRLENLIGQVQMAQQAHSLAPAEVERAYKLTADLRKLAESSVMVEVAPSSEEGVLEAESEADDLLSLDDAQAGTSQAGTSQPGNEVSAKLSQLDKLLQLDLDDERRSLDKTMSDYADLLSYRPELAADLSGYAAQLTAGTSVATGLEALRDRLAAASVAERATLSREFEEIRDTLAGWTSAAPDTTELTQYLQITLSVLDTALPPLRDVQHLRSLYHLASSAAQAGTHAQGGAPPPDAPTRPGVAARASRLAEQLGDLHKLEEQVSRYEGVTLPEFQDLKARLRAARAQLERDEPLDTLADLWALLRTVQTLLERRSTDFGGRVDAALKVFDEVAKLNSEDTVKVGILLQHLDGQRDAVSHVSAPVRDELAAALSQAETLLSELQAQYSATRAVADQLAGSGALGGLFGFFDAPTPPPAQTTGEGTLKRWIAEFSSDPGVQGVALFDLQGRVLASQGLDRLDDLYSGFAKLRRGADELGAELALGETRLTVVELAQTALVGAALTPDYRLALVVAAARLDEALPEFHNRLGELRDILVRP